MRSLLVFLVLLNFTWAKTFTIKKGNHDASGAHFGPFVAKQMDFYAKFDRSAEYYFNDADQWAINKLKGFSDCTSAHHKNSARFGWLWNPNTFKIEIHAYVYKNSNWTSKLMGSIDPNSWNYYQIKVDGNKYKFKLNDISVEMSRKCDRKRAIGYKLYPYFGGNKTAPHDVKIEIVD